MAISGAGSDELFSGYPVFKNAYELNNKKWLFSFPPQIRKLVGYFLTKYQTSEKSKKMIEILAENKRLNLLGTIYIIYQELLEEHKEQKSVEVLVAFDPSKEAEENIKHKLKSKYGDDANISFSKDPQMMGGLSIKIGDEMLDLSIKGKIKKLVNQLTF